MRLDRQGTIVESRCSGWAVDAKIRALKVTEPASALAKMLGPVAGGEAKLLVTALKQGDAAAQRILQETAGDLAFGLSHVVQLFHPEVIVLGGGLTGMGEVFRSAVEQALRSFRAYCKKNVEKGLVLLTIKYTLIRCGTATAAT
ncbi:MAG: hypothetical protein JWR19_1212 [Pedosphaera sp.]|nr:hypothetical protein [Pedosphaera sp.]